MLLPLAGTRSIPGQHHAPQLAGALRGFTHGDLHPHNATEASLEPAWHRV